MDNFIIEKQSRFDFDKTVEMISAEAVNRGWKVPFIFDLQMSLLKAGQEVRPVKIVEICKPAYSGKILSVDADRMISVMMPCRISVYQKEDGNTYISIMDAGKIIPLMPEAAGEVMKAASDETIEIVKQIYVL
jgi:uncharacterized protein (DUF302 family)